MRCGSSRRCQRSGRRYGRATTGGWGMMIANFDLRRKIYGDEAIGAHNLEMVALARSSAYPPSSPARAERSPGSCVGARWRRSSGPSWSAAIGSSARRRSHRTRRPQSPPSRLASSEPLNCRAVPTPRGAAAFPRTRHGHGVRSVAAQVVGRAVASLGTESAVGQEVRHVLDRLVGMYARAMDDILEGGRTVGDQRQHLRFVMRGVAGTPCSQAEEMTSARGPRITRARTSA